MSLLLGLILAAVLPAGAATEVRFDREGWVLEEEETEAFRWRWSDSCAPQKLSRGVEPLCGETRALELQLTDAEGRAVPAARAQWGTAPMLRDLPDSSLPGVTLSDKGTASFAVAASEDVWVRIAGPHAATHWQRVARDATQLRLIAEVAAVTPIRVKGSDGEAVERLHLALLPPGCTTVCPERLLAQINDGSKGEIAGVRGSAYRLIAWSDSHAPLSQMITLSDGPIELTLSRGARVVARLTDSEKNPIPESRLDVELRLPGLRQSIRRTALAGPTGAVQLGGLPLGPVEWTASAARHARRVNEARLDEGENDLGAVVLSPARSARVTVTDRNGVPIEAARVIARGSAAALTDARGRVAFEEIASSEITLHVEAEGFLQTDSIIPADEDDGRVVLERGAGVKATLIRESDGQAPAVVQVRVTNNGRETLRSVDVVSDFILHGLDPGTVRLRISADDTRPFDTGTIELPAGATRDLGVVILKSGLVVHGFVVDETGSAVAGARVRALQTDGDSPVLANVLGRWRETSSGSDGAFRIGGLTREAPLVAIEAQGFAPHALTNLSPEGDASDLDLGIVTLTKGVRVELSCRPLTRCGSEGQLLLAGPEFPFLAVRAPLLAGNAVFHAAPAGDLVLRLSRREHIVHEEAVHIGTDDPQTIELELPSARVAGRVFVGGTPAKGGSLLLTRAVMSASLPILVRSRTETGSTVGTEWLGSFGASTMTEVSARGTFVIEEIEPGDYEVTFRGGGGGTAPVKVTVRDAADQTVDLQFGGHVIAGYVVDGEGRRAAAQLVVVDGAGSSHRLHTGADGAFQILGIATGKARVRASAQGLMAEAEVDPAKNEARELVLRLTKEAPAGVRVTVSEAGGGPAVGALTFLLSGSRLRVASTDGEGGARFPDAEEQARHVLAATRPGGAWAFGEASTEQPSLLSFPRESGTLSIRSMTAGAVTVAAPNGFALDRVLPMLGLSPQLVAGGTLRIASLPPGAYAVTAAGVLETVAVRPGEVTVVAFGN